MCANVIRENILITQGLLWGFNPFNPVYTKSKAKTKVYNHSFMEEFTEKQWTRAPNIQIIHPGSGCKSCFTQKGKLIASVCIMWPRKPPTVSLSLSPQLQSGERKQIWCSFIRNSLCFPARGMCQRFGVWHKTLALGPGVFGKGPEGSHESSRFRFGGCRAWWKAHMEGCIYLR